MSVGMNVSIPGYGVQSVIQKLPCQLAIRSCGVTSALEGMYGHDPFQKTAGVSCNSRECCATRVLVSLMNVLPKALICSEFTYSSGLQTQLKNGRAAGQTSPSVDVTARGDSERERAAKQGISSRASIRSVFLGSCNGWSPAIGPRQDKCMHKCQDIKTPLPPQILDKHSIPLIHG